MSDDWEAIAEWWADVGVHDPSYRHDIVPLLSGLVGERSGTALDLGCGTGHLREVIGGVVIGIDASDALARAARGEMPVAVGRAPDLGFIADRSVDLVVSVYLIDLILDDRRLFAELARIVRPPGALVVVINHPVYTAPGAAPIADEDGEVLWRWGEYFTPGTSIEPAGPGTVVYHHRPLGRLLGHAASAGWHLVDLVERPLSPLAIAEMPGYHGQHVLPRYLGVRWELPRG